MIKIIGGIYRSRVIQTPISDTLPSKNMVRGAMISALGRGIEGARVLDLFAGSGALGIEALSQGASYCDFVDISREAVKVIEGNLRSLKEDRAKVHLGSYESFLQGHSGEPYDIVFIDPPYKMKESYQQALSLLLNKNMLTKNACIILEYEGEIEVDATPFKETRDYKYGKTKVRLLRGLL